jgi:hypothetical protein
VLLSALESSVLLVLLVLLVLSRQSLLVFLVLLVLDSLNPLLALTFPSDYRSTYRPTTTVNNDLLHAFVASCFVLHTSCSIRHAAPFDMRCAVCFASYVICDIATLRMRHTLQPYDLYAT